MYVEFETGTKKTMTRINFLLLGPGLNFTGCPNLRKAFFSEERLRSKLIEGGATYFGEFAERPLL